MRHAYYSYSKEELVSNNPKLPVIVMEDNAAVFRSMAEEMTEEIKMHNEKGEKTVFICPVGPVGQYPFFVEMVNKERISLKNVWFINMDEYLDDEKKWIEETHPLSFRGFMNREVYGKIDEELLMPQEQRVFPDPENLDYIPNLIEKLGGVDICFGGIGINGHVAFNEADPSMSPEEFLAQKTRVLEITKKPEQQMPLVILAALWKICHTIVLPLVFMKLHMPEKSALDASETGTGQLCAEQLMEKRQQISRYLY